MRWALAQAALGLASAGAILAGAAVLVRPWADPVLPPVAMVPIGAESDTSRQVDSLLREAAVRSPFRASRTRPAIAYDPDRQAQPGLPAPPMLAKPVLVLSGIAWGAKPSAVLEGIPGVEGARVLRAGESAGGLTVRRIQRESAVITGLDTTWTLRVRVPWR